MTSRSRRTEHGVIFNTEMERAILSGNDTQPRQMAAVGRDREFTDPVVFGKEGQVIYVTNSQAARRAFRCLTKIGTE